VVVLADKQNTEVSLRARGGVAAARERRRNWGVFDFEQRSAAALRPALSTVQRQGPPAVCTDPASEPQLRDVGHGHVVACHFA